MDAVNTPLKFLNIYYSFIPDNLVKTVRLFNFFEINDSCKNPCSREAFSEACYNIVLYGTDSYKYLRHYEQIVNYPGARYNFSHIFTTCTDYEINIGTPFSSKRINEDDFKKYWFYEAYDREDGTGEIFYEGHEVYPYKDTCPELEEITEYGIRYCSVDTRIMYDKVSLYIPFANIDWIFNSYEQVRELYIKLSEKGIILIVEGLDYHTFYNCKTKEDVKKEFCKVLKLSREHYNIRLRKLYEYFENGFFMCLIPLFLTEREKR